MDDIRETSGIDSTTQMDGDFSTDFEAGLLGDGLENQQTAGQDPGEGGADGLENQQPEGQQEEPENKGAEDGQQPPPAQQERPPVPLTYNGQQILLPGEAVEALRGALGLDPVAVLQKGMNYDHKAARELRLLDQYAAASGMTRQQYIGKLEAAQRQQELAAEVEKCRAEFPEGTPDAALTEIAKNRIASRQAAERQQAMQRQSELQQMQQRAQQAVNQARQPQARGYPAPRDGTGAAGGDDACCGALALSERAEGHAAADQGTEPEKQGRIRRKHGGRRGRVGRISFRPVRLNP